MSFRTFGFPHFSLAATEAQLGPALTSRDFWLIERMGLVTDPPWLTLNRERRLVTVDCGRGKWADRMTLILGT
jgi:hypothetical protein